MSLLNFVVYKAFENISEISLFFDQAWARADNIDTAEINNRFTNCQLFIFFVCFLFGGGQVISAAAEFDKPNRHGSDRLQIPVGISALFDISRPVVSIHHNCTLEADACWSCLPSICLSCSPCNWWWEPSLWTRHWGGSCC